MQTYHASEFVTFIIALVALIAGEFFCTRIGFLKKASIPAPVVGGILTAIVVALIESLLGVHIAFGTHLRDVLILLFFVSLGFTAKISSLRTGGRPLFIICVVTVLLLVLQNLVGIGMALVRGVHPFYGLLGGSISFVGGPGTAMAWATEASALGLKGAELVAISFATLAVSVGAIVSAPIVAWIIKRHKLGSNSRLTKREEEHKEDPPRAATVPAMIRAMLLFAIAVGLGMQLNTVSTGMHLLLPGFLCSLLAGMLLANLADWRKLPMPLVLTDRIGDLALQVFLAISLMSLKISSIGAILVPLVIVLVLQVVLTTVVAYYLLFRKLGSDYDAAVTVGGFIGFAVSSMPVAMATMDQITRRYGPAPKAILLITLAGSFFVDLANTFIVKGFMYLLPAITP